MLEALSSEELLSVLSAARARRERDWLMYLVAFWHGLRASEVVGFTADAVADGNLTIARLKGSNRTRQALVEHDNQLLSEKAPLLEYLSNSNHDGPVFKLTARHFGRLFKGYARTAGIPEHKQHPHVLKHTIAMLTIKLAGIENVRVHLGHKSLSSTGAYLRVSDDDASRAVVGALHGLNSEQ